MSPRCVGRECPTPSISFTNERTFDLHKTWRLQHEQRTVTCAKLQCCSSPRMSKRSVDGSEKIADDDEKEDVSMVDATAETTNTSSEGEKQRERDCSSLFDDPASERFDASQRQSCLSILEQAHERAKSSSQENWDEILKHERSMCMISHLPLVGAAVTDRMWFVRRSGLFLETREGSDLAGHGPTMHQDTAQSAFQLDCESHADDSAFLEHLEMQRGMFLERKEKGTKSGVGGNAPIFAAIQSSGCGKSRLISQILADQRKDCEVICWSFASEKAYPPRNVAIDESAFKAHRREALEKALQKQISVAVENARAGKQTDSATMISPLRTTTTTSTPPAMQQQPNGQKKIVFVVDEASELLGKCTSDGVSYFRALRAAFKTFGGEANWLFFVVMATFSSITHLSPGLTMDPSFKPCSGCDDENQKPLDPFILGSSFRVNNDRRAPLAMKVEACHAPLCLCSMGRPLWKALLTCESPMTADGLLAHGRMKPRNSMKSDANLAKKEEILAVLSARLCLSISPTSSCAPSLVACHMAAALSVSEDRMSVVVTCPSEPVLAVGAKMFMKNQENTGRMTSALQDFLAHGAVEKGCKGELIVRLLMTLAMDKAMGSEEVKQVRLKDHLVCFNRDGADLGEMIKGLESGCCEEFDANEELAKLKRLHLDWSDARAILEARKQNQAGAASRPLTHADGRLCFAHFVHLSKSTDGPLITHDLLRHACRRSAAIVVEEGRRGIDKVIPLRAGEDMFVGLVVQDKNRVSDTLQSLASVDNAATHHKVNVACFLAEDEKQTFRSAGVDLDKHWPAMLFAAGVDEVGADVATQLEQKRFRDNNSSDTERFDFPCIVLAGLDCSNLMDDVAVASLKKLRDFEVVPSDRKKADIPITCGS